MSALGQKRTFAVQNVMSALPPRADIGGASDLSKQHHYSILHGGSTELALQPLLDLHSFR